MFLKQIINTIVGLWILVALQSGVEAAVPGLLSIKISNESGPPGSIVQLKVFVTEPTPISTGFMAMRFDTEFIESFEGISASGAAGEVWGTAVVHQGSLQVWLHSPKGALGMSPDYPILTMAVKLRQTARLGSSMPVAFSLGSSWLNSGGGVYATEVKPGSITVEGQLSIGNVIPGGGLVPAGSPVRITGTGFGPRTKFAVGEAKVTSVRIVSPTTADLTLQGQVSMEGRRIRARNPDGPEVTYFSYLRPVDEGVSSNRLLRSTVPLFSKLTLSIGSLPLPCAGATVVCGVGLLNPSNEGITVSLTLFGPSGTSLGAASLTLPPGSRFVRAFHEVFGRTVPLGGRVAISASAPLQTMGLVVDSLSQSVRPLPFVPGR